MKNQSTGLYVHIPFCQRKCPYCAFYSVPLSGRPTDRLIDALLAEVDMTALGEPPETIYIGGGSPTCLPADTLLRLVTALTQRFGQVVEFTVECNPAQVSGALFERLLVAGVNRISIGAQSFNVEELKMLGRLHGPAQIVEAVQAARRAGFVNINLDLIFGLPGSDLLSWQTTLDKALALEARHFSTYSLTVEQRTPFARAFRQGKLTMIDEAAERTMYELARIQLVAAGFEQYEISNFARPGFQCRHNLRYWKNLPVVGIGPAAAGWYQGRRTMNVHDVDIYLDAIERGRFAHVEVATPTPEQTASETAVLGLRLLEGIDRDQFRRQTGFDLFVLFGDAIEKNCDLGFLARTETHLFLTEIGLSFADAVAEDFIL